MEVVVNTLLSNRRPPLQEIYQALLVMDQLCRQSCEYSDQLRPPYLVLLSLYKFLCDQDGQIRQHYCRLQQISNDLLQKYNQLRRNHQVLKNHCQDLATSCNELRQSGRTPPSHPLPSIHTLFAAPEGKGPSDVIYAGGVDGYRPRIPPAPSSWLSATEGVLRSEEDIRARLEPSRYPNVENIRHHRQWPATLQGAADKVQVGVEAGCNRPTGQGLALTSTRPTHVICRRTRYHRQSAYPPIPRWLRNPSRFRPGWWRARVVVMFQWRRASPQIHVRLF